MGHKFVQIIITAVIFTITILALSQTVVVGNMLFDTNTNVNNVTNSSAASIDIQSQEKKNGTNKSRQKVSSGVLESISAQDSTKTSSTNRITVHIITRPGHVPDVTDNVSVHGGEVRTSYENRILAELPTTAITKIKTSDNIRYIKLPEKPTETGGPIVSEGVKVINASNLHSRGYTGSNVTVGVIDQDGNFNQSNPEVASNVAGTYDITPTEDVQNKSGGHGTAVGETIVDTAPNASLFFIEVEGSIETAQAIDHLRTNTSADVIVMSLGFGSGPFDGSGFIGNAIKDARDNDIPMFVAAGNYADGQHLNISWSDGDSNDRLNFTNSDETLDFRGSGPIFVNWNDFPASSNDYDIYLYDRSGTLIDRSVNSQTGTQPPDESVIAQDCPCKLIVEKFDANGSAEFNIFAYDDDGVFEYNTPAQSIARPATDEAAITIGAVNYATRDLEAFSSRGPTIDGRQKPEFVAPDAASSSVYGTFPGTSQAAPHAAGAAALLKSANRSLTPGQVESALKQTAKQTDSRHQAPTPNNQTGYGLINASAALNQLQANSTQPTQSLISVANASATSGANASTVVTVDSLPGGLSTYNITISVENGTVATISQINTGAVSGTQFETVSRSDTSATVRASDLAGSVQSGAVNVSLGMIGLNNTVEGTTNISVAVNSMTDDNGTRINTQTEPGRLSVSSQQQNTQPTAAFSPPTGPILNGSVVKFNATASADPDGSITTYEWDFDGDGTTDDVGAVTQYQYNMSGRVSTTLTVTDNDGATDTRTEQLLVIKDTNTTATVTLASAPNGLEKYNISLTSSKGPVQAVTPQLITKPAFQFLTDIGDETATVRGSDLAGSVNRFNTSKTLVTMTFSGELNRSDLSLTVHVLTDDQSNPIPSNRVNVSIGQLFTAPIIGGGAQGPPTDPDGDGLYEDINGDGQATFSDAVALSFANTGTLSPRQAGALDFDSDGDVDFSDAVTLSFQT